MLVETHLKKGMQECVSRSAIASANANGTLLAFLHGTIDRHSPLYRLGGQSDVIRKIWSMACEEWWALHIDSFRRDIPELIGHPRWPRTDSKQYPLARKECGGCPAAIIARHVAFPPPATVPMHTFPNQDSEILNINMMPFDLDDATSLPPCCRQYWPIIKRIRNDGLERKPEDINIAYLTIDERPVLKGKSQRRGGLHVESPGFLPVISETETREARFIPGAEHHWGGGMMRRNQKIVGGIFMASNVPNTCAVWNCKIIDNDGSIIGPHGNIERMRPFLAKPALILQAGELVWITDKTPHESLPVHENISRQFIRVVVGDISAWFSDHCTLNPTGYTPPASVRIVRGQKFELYRGVFAPWKCGTHEEIGSAKLENEFREVVFSYDLGHLANALIKKGINSLQKVAEISKPVGRIWWWDSVDGLFDSADRRGMYDFEVPKLEEFTQYCVSTKGLQKA